MRNRPVTQVSQVLTIFLVCVSATFGAHSADEPYEELARQRATRQYPLQEFRHT